MTFVKLSDNELDNKNINVTELKELHQRLIVKQEKKLKEVVVQEEGYVSQNAQIDTPFGLVNGKKVIVTDQVYVPETYITITDIDPITYEYVQRRVVSRDPYYAYTYEIEDIPLITAAYIYNDGDGIKIQGMDDLISALTGGSQTKLDANGNPIISYSNLPSSNITKESFKKLHDTFSSYMLRINDSLSYISYVSSALEQLPNNISEISKSLNTQSNVSEKAITSLSDSLSKNSSNIISADSSNTSNLINAQKTMMSKLTSSIDKQTTTLSRLMLVNMIGASGSYTTAGSSIISNVLEGMSGSTPQNFQSITMTGYEYTYEALINSYKATSYKHTKVIGRDLRNATYITRTGTYNYDIPKFVDFTYTDALDNNLGGEERIGLHLNKETRSFTYNGYVYHEEYYTYQNIADILANLHVSTRLPNRKEFIVDVSKKLYVNSDFVLSYTSDNEYAIRAIRRADILWRELVKANVVEDSKANQRPLPEIITSEKWWNDPTKLERFALIMDLNLNKLKLADESFFVSIDNIIKSKQLVKSSDVYNVESFFDSVTVYDDNLSTITTENRSYALADLFGVTHESITKQPQIISEINKMSIDYKTNLTLKNRQEFEKIGVKV